MAVERPGRILIVDDDAVIRETLASALGDEGYAVRVASNGQVALESLPRWRPDLILLDLMMPVMDGPAFRAAQRSVEGVAPIPVIVLSAAHEVHARALALQPAAVFAKPFDLGALLDAIAWLIGQQSAT